MSNMMGIRRVAGARARRTAPEPSQPELPGPRIAQADGNALRQEIGAASDSHPAEAAAFERSPVATNEGHYDIRLGAKGYAPIIGTLGALAVPAIIVLFTVPATFSAVKAPFIALAAGLLIVSMIASITGAIGMAAIGAERDETANLTPAAMYMAIPVVISLVNVLAAFEVLAALYLTSLRLLFALITGAAGFAGVFFTAMSVIDSLGTGPADPQVKAHWIQTQWLQKPEQAHKHGWFTFAIGAVPALTGVGIRASGWSLAITPDRVNWLIAVVLLLSMIGTFAGVARTVHPVDGVQKGMRPWEGYGIPFALGAYTLTLMIFLP